MSGLVLVIKRSSLNLTSSILRSYVQFNEYLGFVKAMDEFRGMKLVHKEGGELSQAINIIVDFDKTKHLSDVSIKRRKVVRERLIEKERELDEEERKKREQLELKKRIEQEKLEAEKQKEAQKQQQREARRKEKQLQMLKEKECLDFQSKIIEEEKKLLLAQRKLESIRLLEALFARIQMKAKGATNEATKQAEGKHQETNKPPRDLREKLINKYKNAHKGELEKRQDKVRKAREGKVILTDLLADGKRSPSIDSISSDDSIFGSSKKKRKKKKRSNSSSSSSSSSSSVTRSSEGESSKAAKKGKG